WRIETMKRPLIALAAATVLGATATPAFAESLSIPYQDLNLSTAEGQQTLERRIDQAARTFCGIDRPTTGSRISSRDARQCYAATKTQAQKQSAAILDEKRLGG